MESFKNVVLGSMDAGAFIGYFILAVIAAFGMVLYRASKKYKKSYDTPGDFSIRFFLKDNALKWLLQVLTIAFMIRFSNEAVGQEITGWGAVLIGLGSGQLSIWAQTYQNKARD